MKARLTNILKDLCLTPAPSGFEGEIAYKFQDYIEPFCDHIEMDPVGNVIGTITGTDPSLKPVLINAHMDRVGFIVSMIDDDGFLQMRAIGSPNEKVLPGLTVQVRKKDRSAWVEVACGVKCTHRIAGDEPDLMPSLDNVMFDTGAGSAEEVRELGIEIGSPAVFTPSFAHLAGDVVCATALDNCGSVAALILIAENLFKNRPMRTVYIAANVWEEYNQRASTFLVRKYQPIAAISMDMLLAADTPDLKGKMQSSLGKGPAASCFNFSFDSDIGCIAHEGLYDIAEESAQSCGIPLQRYVSGGCGDNAYAMLEGDGPAVIEIGAPLRYAHSSCEVANLSDIRDTAIVVSEMARRITESFSQNRY